MEETTRKRVLIIEDDPIHRKVLAALVHHSHLDGTYTEDGVQGLEQLQKRDDFAAVVVDLHLPRMGGLELIARLKQIAPHYLRRVVVVTGMDDDALRQLDDEPICGILRKPIDLQEFQRVLSGCIDGRQ